MIAAAGIIFVLIVVVTVAVTLGLRRVVADEARLEARLRGPHAHLVTYVVPNGADPAHLRAALNQAGFTCLMGTSGSNASLRVECVESSRPLLREVIQRVHEQAYDGSDLRLDYVVFEDER